MKSMAMLLVAAAALLAAGCGGGDNNSGDGSKATAERADLASYSQQPTTGAPAVSAAGITVVGTGSAKAVPDVAEWSFGVRSEAESAAAAMSQNSAATRRLIDALKRAGIDGDDLRTESVTLYPQTDEMGRNVVGYSASNTVHATMKIAKAGKVIDDAVAAGANEVYGPMLRVSDSDAQYAEAVDEAFDDARTRAEAVAAKAGVTLGRPVAIVEGSGGGGGPIPYGAEAAKLDASVPIEEGSQEIQAVLTVTFAIS